jgi:hypothetical protein
LRQHLHLLKPTGGAGWDEGHPHEDKIAALAPDQSALTASIKLQKPASWPLLGRDGEEDLIWGECQGSGATPYRVMADLRDLGKKYTCPRRKIPLQAWGLHSDPEAYRRPPIVQIDEAPIDREVIQEFLNRAAERFKRGRRQRSRLAVARQVRRDHKGYARKPGHDALKGAR